MCCKTVIITGGPIYPDAVELVGTEDKIVCADSGVDYALSNGIRIDEVFGDFDSISASGKEYIQVRNIPIHKFPCEKDMTDTELAIRSSDKDSDILLICSLQGRPDHVMTNIGLLARLREEGRSIVGSDGHTDIIPLAGDDYIKINDIFETKNKVISLIPFSEKVTGVSTEGLYYELKDAELEYGRSFSTSNELKKGLSSFSVEIKTGRLLIVITDRV